MQAEEGAVRAVLTDIGEKTLAAERNFEGLLAFIGETLFSFRRFFSGKSCFRSKDLARFIQQASVKALPIVSLISFLVGMTFSFVASVQLKQFGAEIYIANLVGLAMSREMGAMMTGIIMAGRTGAAYAAQLGTMQTNEEIDALKTFGISPYDFLVLPRIIALVIMMPLLTLYANVLGILGGAFVAYTGLGLSFMQYFQQLKSALTIQSFVLGLIKAVVFGVLVAIAGCMRGIQSGRSSASVGNAATSAVVTGILYIIVFDALLTIVYNALGV